jgi:hypothetical protein
VLAGEEIIVTDLNTVPFPVRTILQALTTRCPHIQFQLREEFGSSKPNHRLNLRRTLHELLNETEILDLEKVPSLTQGFVSISHCHSLGGFAHSTKPIGFDIEETQRVSVDVANRLLNAKDEKTFPNPASLWGAKESAFKAKRAIPPLVISEMVIRDWHREPGAESGEQKWIFRSSDGQGFILQSGIWSIAVYEINET